MSGYDPIMLEFMPIKEWLGADSQDNMVILGDYIFEKKKVGGILLKKSYFLNGSVNDIYNRCELKDGVDLLVTKTYDSKFYRNIGKYIIDDKNMKLKQKHESVGRRMVDDKKFIRELKKKKNIYELNDLQQKEPFINRTALELSKISLAGGARQPLLSVWNLAKDSAFQDLYFEAKQAEALYKYSTIWDQPINNYLRLTKPVFDEWFTKFCEKRREKQSEGSNWSESETLEKVKRKIKLLDQCFLEHAERNENDTKKYYRGMQWGYGDYKNAKVGDKVLIQNFTSVSTVKKEAEYFKRGNECCMYLIKIEKGLPYINMMKTTKYKKEKEILLPRDVILEYTKVITKKVKTKEYWNQVNHLVKAQGYKVKTAKEMSSMAMRDEPVTFHVTIRKRDKDQFKVDHTCREYPIYDLKVSKKKLKELSVDTVDVVEELEPVQEKSKEDEHPLMKECLVNTAILIMKNKEEGMKMASKAEEYSKKGGAIGKVPTNELEKFNNEILKKIEEFSTTQPKKECPPGKELNPETNRCRKIQVKKKPKTIQNKEGVKKECPPGKELNPKTGRCIKIKSLKKECLPGKEINPKTGRCIKITMKNIPKKVNVPIIKDVLDNLITINGHGTFRTQKVKVPEGFQVLIPHRNGLDADYTTPDADKNKLYEEQLYKENYLNYRDGWKLYLPGDDINNLKISVFHDGASCHTIQDNHKIQNDLIRYCAHPYEYGVKYKNFCPLYCTHKRQSSVWGDFNYLMYKKKRKLKIKACQNYQLNDLFTGLKEQLDKIPDNMRKRISPGPDEPIVLIPFTCNAKSGSKMNPFDHNNKKNLNTIYQELIKNR